MQLSDDMTLPSGAQTRKTKPSHTASPPALHGPEGAGVPALGAAVVPAVFGAAALPPAGVPAGFPPMLGLAPAVGVVLMGAVVRLELPAFGVLDDAPEVVGASAGVMGVLASPFAVIASSGLVL